jgi:hypothetical protein
VDTMVWALSSQEYEGSTIKQAVFKAYDFMGQEILF